MFPFRDSDDIEQNSAPQEAFIGGYNIALLLRHVYSTEVCGSVTWFPGSSVCKSDHRVSYQLAMFQASGLFLSLKDRNAMPAFSVVRFQWKILVEAPHGFPRQP
jgi:hypothetical protein